MWDQRRRSKFLSVDERQPANRRARSGYLTTEDPIFPDGKRIAFESERPGSHEVWVQIRPEAISKRTLVSKRPAHHDFVIASPRADQQQGRSRSQGRGS